MMDGHPLDDGNEGGSASYVNVESGEALDEQQAAKVTRENSTRVIIIVGPVASGKTTILTSLYEAFLEAPFANFLFKGSHTLLGFEQRSHPAREESGAYEADTARTPISSSVMFMHLNVAWMSDRGTNSLNLLMSDVSGELYTRIRDNSTALEAIPSLKRADSLTLVVDGQKIIDRAQRHVARNDSRSLLRSIVEGRVLKRDCVVNVVITKWDVVSPALEADQSGEIARFIHDTKQALVVAAGHFNVEFHEVAARPPTHAKVPFAHGLPTLLRHWVESKNIRNSHPILYQPSSPVREMSRFTQAVVANNELEARYDIRQF